MKNHALKIEEVDVSKAIADGIVAALQAFALELGFSEEHTDALECRSRDGFIPYSHNKGGIGAHAYQSQLHAYIERTGFDHADAVLDRYYQYTADYYAEANNLSKDVSTWSDDQRDEMEQGYAEDSESTVFFKLQAMYQGINDDGMHSIDLSCMVNVSDAPYHRGYDDIVEIELKFKTVAGLKKQLATVLKRDDVNTFALNVRNG